MGPGSLALLALVGVVAGVVNSLAGGGSLLTLPALVFVGLPPHVANGTNRVGILLSSGAAVLAYRQDGEGLGGLEWLEAVAVCVGAALGAAATLALSEQAFRSVIGWVMLGMLGVVLIRPKAWIEGRASAAPAPARAAGFLVTGAYAGFIQAGVGVMLLAAFVLLSGCGLRRANVRKVAVVGLLTVPAMGVFLAADLVRWVPGLALALGSAVGGWAGARLAGRLDPRWVRWVLVVAVSASAGRMLGWW